MKIFLSYSSADRKLAEQINLALLAEGHDVFFDRDDLEPGEGYNAEIRRFIEACDLFVFLITPESIASGRYTRTELKIAQRRWQNPSGRVLPVMLAPTPFDEIPSYLKAVTVLTAEGNLPAEVAAEVAAIERRHARAEAARVPDVEVVEPAAGETPEETPAVEPARSSRRGLAPASYKPVRIIFGAGAPDGYPVDVEDAPESSRTIHPCAIDADELGRAVWASEDEVDTRVRKSAGAAARLPSAAALQAVGERLYEALLATHLEPYLVSSLRAIDPQRGAGLRFLIDTTHAPELASLPWEFLYSRREDDFLFCDVMKPVVRWLDLDRPLPRLDVEPPLRLLVAVASPADQPELRVGDELAHLADELAELEAEGLVALRHLERASLERLDEALVDHAPHLLHFIGHGDFAGRDGVLLLESADHPGMSAPCKGRQLAVLLRNHLRTLRFVFLNSCLGAAVSRRDPFGGIAQSLMRRGVPAVVAMQFPIPDRAAVILARQFYRYLAAGSPVDAALTEARAFLLAKGREVEWGAPALYLRTPDARLFNFGAAGPAAAAAAGAAVAGGVAAAAGVAGAAEAGAAAAGGAAAARGAAAGIGAGSAAEAGAAVGGAAAAGVAGVAGTAGAGGTGGDAPGGGGVVAGGNGGTPPGDVARAGAAGGAASPAPARVWGIDFRSGKEGKQLRIGPFGMAGIATVVIAFLLFGVALLRTGGGALPGPDAMMADAGSAELPSTAAEPAGAPGEPQAAEPAADPPPAGGVPGGVLGGLPGPPPDATDAVDSLPAGVLVAFEPSSTPPQAMSGRIEGRVVLPDGSGVGGVTVVIDELGEAAITDRDGTFVFRGVPVGAYTLAFSIGDNADSENVTVAPGAFARIDKEIDWDVGFDPALAYAPTPPSAGVLPPLAASDPSVRARVEAGLANVAGSEPFSYAAIGDREVLRAGLLGYRAEIEQLLAAAGWQGDVADFFDAVGGAGIAQAQRYALPPGTVFYWLGRRYGGAPVPIAGVGWAGPEPLVVWQLVVNSRGWNHVFVIPESSFTLAYWGSAIDEAGVSEDVAEMAGEDLGDVVVTGSRSVRHLASTPPGWTLRGSAVYLDPGAGALDAGAGFGLALERRLGHRLGLELGVAAAELDRRIGAGDVRVVPVTLGLDLHLTPGRRTDVYLGPVLGYLTYDGERPGDGLEDFVVGVKLGVDVPISGSWGFSGGLLYLDANGLDPAILTLGVAYRF